METNGKIQVPGTPEELFQRGDAAYSAGDYETAFPLLKQAAEQGHAEAQFKCGVMYLTGRGTPADKAQALMWTKRAAEGGFAEAQFNFGVSCQSGDGVPVDKPQALMWYEKSAAQNYGPAQFNCGTMYENGEDVPEDLSKALYWYSQAANRGHIAAMNNLALMYRDGEAAQLRQMPEGVLWESALSWLEQAIRMAQKAEQADMDADSLALLGVVPGRSLRQLREDAQFNYAETLYQRGGPEDLTAALGWFEKLGAQGDLEAQKYCAKMYGLGKGTAPDQAKEFMWNEAAARQGDAHSQFNCAVMCEKGQGTAPDMDKALMWYQAAAGQTKDMDIQKKARSILADEMTKLFYQGNDARRAGDSQTALALYEKCANLGADLPCDLCGIMYATGEGMDAPDLEKAFQWFLKGAEREHPECQFNLAVMYYNGDGIARRDKEKARLWFRKAAGQTKDMDVRKKALASLEQMSS